MEFYRLDYSLAIFKPETNLTGDLDKTSLASKAGFKNGARTDKPLLMQVLEGFLSGEKGASSPAPRGPSLIEAPSYQLPEQKKTFKSGVDSTEKNLAKADDLLREMDREEKRGFNLAGRKKSLGDDLNSRVNFNNNKVADKDSDENIDDKYEDDFSDDIEEDLPEDNQPDPVDEAADSRNNVAITVSQSLGVDPSVDSLALEDYDHVEPVERIS